MRKLLIAALLAAGPAFAQEESPFLKGAALQAEVAKTCSEGCIVFSPAEVETLKQQIEQMARQREQLAYAMGKQIADQTCRNRI